MTARRFSTGLVTVVVVVVCAAPTAARAGPTVAGANPCPHQASYEWMGHSIAQTVKIPSLTKPDGIESYAGTALRPADTAAFPGQRPVVVLQHGSGGDQCALWWVAQDLAGHGYVTVVWTVPSGPAKQNVVKNLELSLDATRSAIAFTRTANNPFRASSDPNRIAVAGSSLGAIVASLVQGDPDPGVVAAVGFDNLVRFTVGSDSPVTCDSEVGIMESAPRVPALSFNSNIDDAFFADINTLKCTEPEAKQRAFRHWREHGVPSMELVMRDYSHSHFSREGSETQRLDMSHFVRAWLDRWMLDDPGAEDRLLATSVRGRPTESLLATEFFSGAFLPPRINTSDYAAWLKGEQVAPNATPGPAARGIARMRALGHRCRRRPFTVSVTGRSIQHVRFSVDGRRLRGARRRGNRFHVRVRPRKLPAGRHRIAARVGFRRDSQTRPRTLARRFTVCARPAKRPAKRR